MLLGTTAVGGLVAFWAAAELFSRDSAGSPQGAGAVEISVVTDRVLREVPLSAPNDVEAGLGAAFVTGTTRSTATVARVPPVRRESRVRSSWRGPRRRARTTSRWAPGPCGPPSRTRSTARTRNG